MGRVWPMDAVAKNASTSQYGNIVALDESPVAEGLLYAGTDDGLIQVTEDGGANWRKIDKFPGVPDLTYVNDIVASHHDRATVYAAFNNHKRGDFKPYVLKSTDLGKTWTSIASDLPERGSVYALAEDHVRQGPALRRDRVRPVRHPRRREALEEARLGPADDRRPRPRHPEARDRPRPGHVRPGFLCPRRLLAAARRSSPKPWRRTATLFPVKDAWMFVEKRPLGGLGSREKGFQGESYFTAPNPPVAAVFTYHLKDAPKSLRRPKEGGGGRAGQGRQARPLPDLRAAEGGAGPGAGGPPLHDRRRGRAGRPRPPRTGPQGAQPGHLGPQVPGPRPDQSGAGGAGLLGPLGHVRHPRDLRRFPGHERRRQGQGAGRARRRSRSRPWPRSRSRPPTGPSSPPSRRRSASSATRSRPPRARCASSATRTQHYRASLKSVTAPHQDILDSIKALETKLESAPAEDVRRPAPLARSTRTPTLAIADPRRCGSPASRPNRPRPRPRRSATPTPSPRRSSGPVYEELKKILAEDVAGHREAARRRRRALYAGPASRLEIETRPRTGSTYSGTCPAPRSGCDGPLPPRGGRRGPSFPTCRVKSDFFCRK